jgi:hypothetical protein
MATVAAAFPFIEVHIDTSALTPIAERAPGVVAVVGKTPNGAAGGSAAANVPLAVDTADQIVELFAREVGGVVTDTPLSRSLKLALAQDPKPSKIYGVRVAGGDYGAALSGLEGADDVTFVALAEEPSVGAAATNTTAATDLLALKAHVEGMSAEGNKRIGVAMIDPARAKSPTYVADASTAVALLKSDSSRMIMIAARGATGDAATAAMAAIAGYEPHISVVLKKVRGVGMPLASQYGPSEIKGLSEEEIVPIIDPALIPGTSLHLAEGRTFTSDLSMLFIDQVRTIDAIDFALKAGLVGAIGDARITKSGLTQLKARFDGILGPLLKRAVIDGYSVRIPVLDVLSVPETARTATDDAEVSTARANRRVDVFVSITYGPAVHRLLVTLAPKF